MGFCRLELGQPQFPNYNFNKRHASSSRAESFFNKTLALLQGAGKAEQMSTVIDPKASDQNAAPPSPTSTRSLSQPLGLNARRVISKRYSLKDAQGQPIEEWDDIVRRVVGHVSEDERDSG